jgi:hypothetical protein
MKRPGLSFSVFSVFVALSFTQGWAAKAKSSTAPSIAAPEKVVGAFVSLDTVSIHTHYSDGDFDKVIAALDPLLGDKSKMSHPDSLFLFKHLGVIYSKDPGTREKGKYCFRKLLDVDGQAQILDMYATDEIYQVYRTVKEEWALTHPGASAPAPSTSAAVTPNNDQPPVTSASPAPNQTMPMPTAKANRKGPSWKTWTAAGGAVAVTAGLTTWYLLSQQPDKKTVTERVDPLSSDIK